MMMNIGNFGIKTSGIKVFFIQGNLQSQKITTLTVEEKEDA